MSKEIEYVFKILTLGESGVGKTCILVQYTEEKFLKTHIFTIGIDYKVKLLQKKNKIVKLKIWDTAGQEKFRTLTQQYYKNSDGILLVFDLDNRQTYNKIKEWMEQIQYNICEEQMIPIVLVGNKSDLKTREVTAEEGNQMAKNYGLKFFEVSALKDTNIKEAFECLTDKIIERKQIIDLLAKKEESPNNSIRASMRLSIERSNKKKPNSKKCCEKK